MFKDLGFRLKWDLEFGIRLSIIESYISFTGVPFWIARATRNAGLEDVRRVYTSNVPVASDIRSQS